MKLVFTSVIVAAIAITFFVFQKNQPATSVSTESRTQISSPTPIDQEPINITASFTVVTNGTNRDFTSSKYHNLSPDIYIESTNPSLVKVTKKGTTWDNFFKTLPMKLTKDCLTTGTNQTFCTGQNGTLRFYLNDNEDKNLLDKEITQGDKILIEFSKK